MSSPKAPQQAMLLSLSDPDHVKEVFATELSGIGFGETLHLTFSVVRPCHKTAGVNKAEHERVIVDRVVMPGSALPKLIQQFQQAAAVQQQHQQLVGVTPTKPH